MKVPASEEHAGKLTYAHRCSTGVSHLRDHERSLRSRGHRRTGHLTQLGQNWNALFGDADRLACSRDQALAERFFIINKEFEQNQISFGHVHFGRGNGPFREVTFGKKRKASHIIYRGWLRCIGGIEGFVIRPFRSFFGHASQNDFRLVDGAQENEC